MPQINGNWNKWWPRVLQVSGLIIVFLIVFQHTTLDPYFYPILGLMLGFPLFGWIEGAIGKKNGNGKT